MDSNGGNGKNGRKKRKRSIVLGSVTVALVAVIVIATAALRPTHTIEPDKLATAERGDIARSVVATGRIEPLTKVGVKSKASVAEAGANLESAQAAPVAAETS